jgi:putative peptide zinc metalloprotease protein
MAESSLFSASWYRVAEIKPRLKSHLEIHRHHYRGELWYVLQDHSSGRFQRFTPSAHMIIGLMDGNRTVQEIWESARAHLKENAPTQEEVIRILSQLHAVDALQSDVLPDTKEMLKRFEKQRSSKWKQNLRNPLFFRLPVFDPERILAALWPLVRPLFGRAGGLVWLAVTGYAVFLAGIHWSALTENLADRILTPGNLFVVWLIFPFIKAFHEFGHAFAVRKRGGEVHEMGVMMLVFTPIPYVDASAASAFRSKWERVLVGAAGMMAELFLASLALFVWVNVEPGPVRAVAYNVIIIAGISTLLFNGNPLLRYDAYYILGDLLEIPNMGSRGIRYLFYLAQRYLFGVKDLEPPMVGPGERAWLVIYTILSFLYRMFVYAGIILFIAGKFFFVGVLIAAVGLFNMFIMPIVKFGRYLFTSPRLRRRRAAAIAVSGGIAALIAIILFFVPVPFGTMAQGVIWVPEYSFVRAGADGFVDKVIAEPGSRVQPGELLVESSDPLLPAQIRVLEARLSELRAIYETKFLENRVEAQIAQEEMRHVAAELADMRGRAEELMIRSATDGVFLAPAAQDLPGRFLRRGDLLGYVLDNAAIIARVVVSQDEVDFVRRRTRDVNIRFADGISAVLPATLMREVPEATDLLPSRVLGREGGGAIANNPREGNGIRSFEKIFLFDIKLPPPEHYYRVGGRIHVRFDHGSEPLAWRWYRGIRALFLKRFNV